MLGSGSDGTGTDGTGTDESEGDGETTGGGSLVGGGGGGSLVGGGGGGSLVGGGGGGSVVGGGGGGSVVGGAGVVWAGVVWAGVVGAAVVCVPGVVGDGECDFEGAGVGRGAGDNAGPMNGILNSGDFGFALFVGLTCAVLFVDLLGECVDDRVGVPWGDRVEPVIVSEGIGAGDGLSNLNCGSAPPL